MTAPAHSLSYGLSRPRPKSTALWLDLIARWLLFAALFSVSFTNPDVAVPGVGVNVSDVLLAASALVSFAGYRSKRTVPPSVRIAMVGTALYALGLFLTAAFSDDKLLFLDNTIKYLIATAIGCLLAIRLLRSQDSLLMAIRFAVAGAALNGLIGGVEMVQGASFFHQEIEGWGRFSAATEHPNELGAICAVFGALAFHVAISDRWKATWFFWMCLGGTVIGLVASASMGAAIGFAVAVGVSLFASRKPLLALLILATGPFALPLVLSLVTDTSGTQGGNSLGLRLMDLLGSGSDYTTAQSRLSEYSLAWEAIRENPFIGHNLTSEALAHNFALYAWSHGGILALVGTLTFVGFMSLGIWMTYSRVRNHQSVLPGAAMITMIAFAAVIFVSPPAVRRSTWVPTWIVAATIGVFPAMRRRAVLRMPWETGGAAPLPPR